MIDCAPSLSLITVNALAAVDSVIIPMQCEYYALEGLADLTQTIDRIQQALNPNLQITGVLRTMYDARNALTRDVSAELEQFFGKSFTIRLFRVMFDWPRRLHTACRLFTLKKF